MIKDLTYSVTFPTNGLSLQGQLSPPPGFTAVTGENGAGKSFGAIELPRYMLFGKRALRGPASDYKALDATMSFEISGTEYRVTRNRKKEELVDASGTTLAIGAEAIDKAIPKLLGFGLEVFDVCCASVQKDSDRLSRLKPTERKRLIDEVVGLTANESVEKACRDEARGLRREAEALRGALTTLEEPVKPEGYRAASELAAELADTRERISRRDTLTRIVAAVGPAPVAPERTVGDIAALEQHENERRQLIARRDNLVREIGRIADAQWSAAELDLAEAWDNYRAECQRRGPQPTITQYEADAGVDAWSHYGAAKSLVHLEVDCPNCHHRFTTNGDAPIEPERPLAFYRAEQRANDAWATALEEPVPQAPPLTKQDIRVGREAIARAADKARLQRELDGLRDLADRSAELRTEQELQAAWAAHSVALRAHEQRAAAAAEATAELSALGVIANNVDELDAAFVAARIYESKLETYAHAKARNDELVATIADKLRSADAFKAGGEALSGARATLKAHLAPSLSRIASSLIFEMTGGALNSVVVDEDMNITVDGQDIATLSGAGSTVANLALRIALGQILVRGAFPVFIADEADADMSAKRAQFTMECLGSLREQLKQIVVITHKKIGTDVAIEVDHLIDLDKTPGD